LSSHSPGQWVGIQGKGRSKQGLKGRRQEEREEEGRRRGAFWFDSWPQGTAGRQLRGQWKEPPGQKPSMLCEARGQRQT